MSGDHLLVERDAGVATLTLNRPAQLNALDWNTVKALLAAFRGLDAEPAVRVALITGRGRAVSAGGDLDAYRSLYRRPEEFRRFLDDFHALLELLERSSTIVIAVVNGVCMAGAWS